MSATVRALTREVLRRGGHVRRPRGAFVAALASKLAVGGVGLDPELRGAGYYSAAADRIVINGTGDVAFTLAHELGHWAFRHMAPALRFPAVSHADEERNANAFARALLGRDAREVA